MLPAFFQSQGTNILRKYDDNLLDTNTFIFNINLIKWNLLHLSSGVWII